MVVAFDVSRYLCNSLYAVDLVCIGLNFKCGFMKCLTEWHRWGVYVCLVMAVVRGMMAVISGYVDGNPSELNRFCTVGKILDVHSLE